MHTNLSPMAWLVLAVPGAHKARRSPLPTSPAHALSSCPCRVKIVDKRAKGGRLYLKKGTIVDVKTPTGERALPPPAPTPMNMPRMCVWAPTGPLTGAGMAGCKALSRTALLEQRPTCCYDAVAPTCMHARPAARRTRPPPTHPPPQWHLAAVCDVFVDDLKQSVLVRGQQAGGGQRQLGA